MLSFCSNVFQVKFLKKNRQERTRGCINILMGNPMLNSHKFNFVKFSIFTLLDVSISKHNKKDLKIFIAANGR